MTFLESLPVTRVRPVLCLPFFARTLRDHSGFGNHATVANAVTLDWKRINRSDGLSSSATGRLSVANSAELQAVSSFTLLWWGSQRPSAAADRKVFSKRDAGGTQIDIYWDTTGALALYDGANERLGPVHTFPGLRSVAVSGLSGSKATVYQNGAELGLMADVSTITGDDAPISLLNHYDGTLPNNGATSGLVFYADTLHPDEISALHAWSQERKSPLVQANRRYFDQGSLVSGQETDLIAAWDMELVGGTIVDKTGNGNDGTATQVAPEIGAGGLTGLSFDGSDVSDVNCGDIAGLKSAATLSWSFLFSPRTLSDFDGVGLKYVGATDRFGLQLGGAAFGSNAGLLCQLANGDAASAYVDNVLIAEETYHVVMVYDGAGVGDSGKAKLYVDGVNQTLVFAGTLPAATSASADNYILGRDTSAAGRTLDGTILESRIYDTALLQAQVSELYRQHARQVTFSEDLSQARPSVASEGGAAGQQLGNTEWFVGDTAGRWQVKEDVDGKWIECMTAGLLYRPSPQAFGTWQFEVSKLDASTFFVMFSANAIKDSYDANQSGYGFAVDTSEALYLQEMIGGDVTDHGISVAAYVTVDTWYTIRVTRRYDGVFNYYIKGGTEFPSWQLIVAGDDGTNPFTDLTVTVSKYTVIDLDAGDRIRNFRYYQGVLPPL